MHRINCWYETSLKIKPKKLVMTFFSGKNKNIKEFLVLDRFSKVQFEDKNCKRKSYWSHRSFAVSSAAYGDAMEASGFMRWIYDCDESCIRLQIHENT